jgi:hypothetical protein
MDKRIETLESWIETATVEGLLDEYRRLVPDRPLYTLVEDIQQQAMIYANIIELLKLGQSAAEIKKRFEELDLVPEGTLPNPDLPRLLAKAFDMISRYRQALVDIAKKHGGQLLNELSFELELTVSVGVDIGIPPSITLAVAHTAKEKTITQF